MYSIKLILDWLSWNILHQQSFSFLSLSPRCDQSILHVVWHSLLHSSLCRQNTWETKRFWEQTFFWKVNTTSSEKCLSASQYYFWAWDKENSVKSKIGFNFISSRGKELVSFFSGHKKHLFIPKSMNKLKLISSRYHILVFSLAPLQL